MKQVLFIILSLFLFNNVFSQLFGGLIIPSSSPSLTSLYPSGSVFCASGPTAIIDVTNPTTGKTWMDRNLGASQAATNITDAAAYGDFYQWGRGNDGHQCRNSSTTTTVSSSNSPSNNYFIVRTSNPFDWRVPQNNSLWQGVNGINNPCPIGYRLPTDSELNIERLSWLSNNTSGAFGSNLKFTPGGVRFYSGAIITVGNDGWYWTSTINSTFSKCLYIIGSDSYTMGTERGNGLSIRCIKN